jgi:hypothetical protein
MEAAKKPSAFGDMSTEEVRRGVVIRLRSRISEIAEAIVAATRGAALDPAGQIDRSVEDGMLGAVSAALAVALRGVEYGDGYVTPIPFEVVAHAHQAARCGVDLGTLLRYYTTGHAVVGAFVLEEADRGGTLGHSEVLRCVHRTQARLLDRLIVSISEKYSREALRIAQSPDERRAETVRQLLAGEPVTSMDLGYDLDVWHVAVIGTGLGVGQAIRGMAAGLDSRVLCVPYDAHGVWGWLGGTRDAVGTDIERLLSTRWPAGISLALGNREQGAEGWRDSHWQAQDALLVSQCRGPQPLTQYADVAFLAPWLRDKRRARWLVEMYLSPLDNCGGSGVKLRATLRAYFAAGHNASAAGQALNVTRRTIRNRMNLIHRQLGPLLTERQAELELALQLDELQDAITAYE